MIGAASCGADAAGCSTASSHSSVGHESRGSTHGPAAANGPARSLMVVQKAATVMAVLLLLVAWKRQAPDAAGTIGAPTQGSNSGLADVPGIRRIAAAAAATSVDAAGSTSLLAKAGAVQAAFMVGKQTHKA